MPAKMHSEKVPWQIQSDDIIIISETSQDKEKNTILQRKLKNLKLKNEQLSSILLSTFLELTRSKKEVQQNKSELQKVTRELFETNQALCVLAKNIDNEKVGVEKRILQAVRTKIMPIIKELQKKDHMKKYRPELSVLATYIDNLVEIQPEKYNIITSLTDMEMRIATLIKDGLTSNKIADMLFLSIETVKTHRKNIRKKLSLKYSDANLASYLKSII